MAEGFEAEQADSSGMGLVSCSHPSSDMWFVGSGEPDVWLYLMNPGTAEASVDVTILTDTGQQNGLSDAITVAPDQVIAENVSPYVHGAQAIAMHVQTSSGQIAADITLRDKTLPTDQAELDEFSQGLSSRFAGQGLTLFTDPAGNVPSGGGTPAQSGYVGYAGTITVNAAVSADPSLVRDGTNAVAGFTPNPASGPAGFTGLITNVVNFTFGSQAQNGVAQPAMNTGGLGASGTLNAPFGATGDALSDFATSLVSSQSQQSATTTNSLSTEQALQTSLSAKVSAVSGVNMDTEVSQMLSLQNAYGANARVIAGVQAMFTQLLQAVQ